MGVPWAAPFFGRTGLFMPAPSPFEGSPPLQADRGTTHASAPEGSPRNQQFGKLAASSLQRGDRGIGRKEQLSGRFRVADKSSAWWCFFSPVCGGVQFFGVGGSEFRLLVLGLRLFTTSLPILNGPLIGHRFPVCAIEFAEVKNQPRKPLSAYGVNILDEDPMGRAIA